MSFWYSPTVSDVRESGTSRLRVVQDELLELFLREGFADFGVGGLAQRLHCSRSTLYAIAPSKEQLISAVVRRFFRRATGRVEARLLVEDDPVARIDVYLTSIAGELAPASAAFFRDLEQHAPAREIYRQNTRIAASRVEELVRTAAGTGTAGDADFIGAVAAQTMESIHRGEVRALTGRDDAAAYRALARLVVAGVSGRSRRS